jgi:hypothetical protein
MKKLLMLVLLASFSVVLASASSLCASGTDATVPPGPGDSFSLTSVGSCAVGGVTFSNFSVFLAVGPFPAGGFSVNVFTDPAGGIDIDYTGISAPADFHLAFEATPGITSMILETGVGSTVSEGVCNTAFNVNNGSSACGPNLLNQTPITASNGGTITSLITFAGTDFFFKDISGGSEVTELIAPEPMTLSMMGVGLLGLGIFGRRRSSK